LVQEDPVRVSHYRSRVSTTHPEHIHCSLSHTILCCRE
jgi:hypothetical protein